MDAASLAIGIGGTVVSGAILGVGKWLVAQSARRNEDRLDALEKARSEEEHGFIQLERTLVARIVDLEKKVEGLSLRREMSDGEAERLRDELRRVEGKIDDAASALSAHGQMLAAIDATLREIRKSSSPPPGLTGPRPEIPPRPRAPSKPGT